MPRIEAVETEATLKGKLVKDFEINLVGSVVLRHEDRFTAGIPDISITWSGFTTWLEVKHMNPDLKSRGVQTLTARRLAAASGRCWFVIYIEVDGIRRTMIVHPQDFTKTRDGLVGHISDGFNHRFVTNFVKSTHSNR